eukprot:GDKJ01000182.1.p1 GENE.GDKJ01000182.1~~GDKJ01000182.1.p1  ORF type:complete len:593 (-),score=143.80 GDKJ01000182.1:152-1909(-)
MDFLPFFWKPDEYSRVAKEFQNPKHLVPDVEKFQTILNMNAKINQQVSYAESSADLKRLLGSKLFSANDLLRQNAGKLFACHRESGSLLDGGLGVRTTVQLNLFGGSVANLGDAKQREWLQKTFDREELGCFALTEAGAGVLSGLVVLTTAKWTPEGYIFSSGKTEEEVEKAKKVWISQGFVAKWAVVIARLILPGENGAEIDKGPHAFVVDLDTPGVERIDMPRKVAFNSLDNAILIFRDALVNHDALLRGVSFVDGKGKYCLADESRPFRFEDVAQRLLSGRICIAGASLSFLSSVQDGVEEFAAQRMMPTGKEEWTALADMPFMHSQLQEKRDVKVVLHRFVRHLEEKFQTVPLLKNDLVDKIASAKIVCVEFAIAGIAELKERVGALSLFDHGPFGVRTDFLYVFRFAEGDSAVLRQKMARDALKVVQKNPMVVILKYLCLWMWSILRFGVFHPILSTCLGFLASVITPTPNETRAELYRGSMYLDVVYLTVIMMMSGKKQMMKAWRDNHSLIETVADKISILNIYDTVKHDDEIKNSRQLNSFTKRFMDRDVKSKTNSQNIGVFMSGLLIGVISMLIFRK